MSCVVRVDVSAPLQNGLSDTTRHRPIYLLIVSQLPSKQLGEGKAQFGAAEKREAISVIAIHCLNLDKIMIMRTQAPTGTVAHALGDHAEQCALSTGLAE